MSEDERATVRANEDDEDVEAHRSGHSVTANDEAGEEGDDDFEAHRTSSKRPPSGV